ncbi:MAG: polysaccharide pyruvyl transferase family protein [Coprobacter sp.]|nr:polysaccharide pyruvyl transferase family protein [Coprobacter sp.]
MKKIIILGNAPINNGNRGCVALSYTSIYLIDKILSDRGIDYKLFLSDSGYHEAGEYEIEINGKRIVYTNLIYKPGITWKERIKAMLNLPCLFKSLYILRQADCILDIGQGDSFADIYGKYRFNLIDRLHKVARLLSKPYCLLPQTIGPFRNSNIRLKAHKSLLKAQMVMARDKISHEYLRQNVPAQKSVGEYIDVAFFLPYTPKKFDKKYIHVGINISALLWHGGYTQNNQFELIDDYQKIIREIVDYFLQMQDVQIHFVPHVVGGERHIENDYAVSYDLLAEYDTPHITLAPLFLDPISAKGYIAGLDFFIGARMHATIAAFSSGVPVVPMAYSRKFNGLFVDTLNYKYVADLKTDASDSVLSLVQDAFVQRNQLQGDINNRLESVVEEKKQMLVRDIDKFLLGK